MPVRKISAIIVHFLIHNTVQHNTINKEAANSQLEIAKLVSAVGARVCDGYVDHRICHSAKPVVSWVKFIIEIKVGNTCLCGRADFLPLEPNSHGHKCQCTHHTAAIAYEECSVWLPGHRSNVQSRIRTTHTLPKMSLHRGRIWGRSST